MSKASEKKKSSWLFRAVSVLGAAGLIFLVVALSKEMYRKKEVQKEVIALKEEAARIEKENLAMEDKLAYFESRDFQEKEARDKLNLQDPAENLVVIKPSASKEALEEGENRPMASAEVPQMENITNPKRWWNYFFKY